MRFPFPSPARCCTRALAIFALAIALLPLQGCLDSEESTEPILTGTAATGAPIVDGTVTVRDAAGRTTSAFTDSTGTYLVRIDTLSAPFVIQVRGGRIAGQPNLVDYHSVAWQRGIANLTPLTDLVVAYLSGNANAAFFANPGGNQQAITPDRVAAAQNAVVTLLGTFVTGVSWGAVGDFVTRYFTAQPANFHDAALERLKGALAAAGAPYTWSTLLAQTGTLSGNRAAAPAQSTTPPPPASTAGAALTASNSAPASGNGTLVATSVVAENAGGSLTDSTRIRVAGTVGTQSFEIQVYYKTATGTVFNVSYGWGVSPTSLGNNAFVSAPAGGAVTGASVNVATGVATFANVVLDGAGAVAATLNGTVSPTGAGNGGGTPGSIAGTWNLAISGTAAGQPINQTVNNVPLGDIPATQNAFDTTSGTFGDTFATPIGDLIITVSNLTSSYTADVKGVVGDTITGTYGATYTYAGSLPVPPITVNLTYTYTRVQ